MAGTERAAATPGDKKNPVFLLAFPKKRRQKHRMIVTNLPTPGHVVPSTGKLHKTARRLCTPVEITEKNLRNFWKKVVKQEGDGCWNWVAFLTSDGYGLFGLSGKLYTAHRVSYYLHFGCIPVGVLVCHKCDNPNCVRPDHLFLGSQFDNVHDMKRKGRERKATGDASAMKKYPELVQKGEKHPKAILSEAAVLHIRANYKGSCSSMAPHYGVSTCTIRDIIKRRSWRHI